MEVKFTGQSKATTCQIKIDSVGNPEENDKILEEAKRLYAKGLGIATQFTMAQSR
jgi:hypothetical protein